MSESTAVAARTLGLLALAAAATAAPGLFDRVRPLDCAAPSAELVCEEKPCVLRCRSPETWRDFPYLALRARGDGEALFRWSAAQFIELEPGTAADAGALWEGTIGPAELVVAGRLRIDGLEVHSRLGPLARLRLAARELLAPEPYSASSNNTIAPRWVLHSSLAAWCGFGSLAALIGLSLRAARRGGAAGADPWLLAVLLSAFLLVSAGPLVSLAAQALRATSHSALHATLRAEEESRYGAPFAELADAFRARVPPGATVLFPRDKEHAAESETHWMDYHFWPEWRSVPADGGTPSYVFWYRPLFLRREGDAIVDPRGATLLRVRPLAVLDPERAILEVTIAAGPGGLRDPPASPR